MLEAPRLCFVCELGFRCRHPVLVEIASLVRSTLCFKRYLLNRKWKQEGGSWASEDWKTNQPVCGVRHSPVPLSRKLLVDFSSCDDNDVMFQASYCTVNNIMLFTQYSKCLWIGIQKWKKCIQLKTAPTINCIMDNNCKQYNYSHCYSHLLLFILFLHDGDLSLFWPWYLYANCCLQTRKKLLI